jgi:dihydrofolate reductase
VTVSLIVAMTDDRVIGLNNKLPWHLSEDLKRFKKITMGHPIIMGRKTFESIGKPLPGRQNIVVTRNQNFKAEGVSVVNSLQQALLSSNGGEKFVIGGAKLFEAALPLADKIYMTLIHHSFQGDVYFPQINLKHDLNITEKIDAQSPPPNSFSYSFLTADIRR